MSDALRIITEIPRLPHRESAGHKGSYGRVLVIGGSAGMLGAPALTGMAALRGGAGLVSLAVPEPIQPYVATMCPCATTMALPSTPDGRIDAQASRTHFESLLNASAAGFAPDVVAIGPGVGRGDPEEEVRFWELIDLFRRQAEIPVIVDADALNMLHRDSVDNASQWERAAHPRTVITPHPGEMARMHGVSPADVQKDREGFATRTATTMNARAQHDAPAIVVLKGAGTLVCDGAQLYTNTTGNPGMATGGSGDVLTGIIAALVGQGLGLFEAGVAGVYVHGLAGDAAAEIKGQPSLIATDLIDKLPLAMQHWLASS